MKKQIRSTLFFLLVLTNIVAAQKLPVGKNGQHKVKQTTKKRLVPPAIKPPMKVEVEAPPIDKSGGATPVFSESSSEIEFRKKRICADCDTLKLAANKAHIIVYDVKWMYDANTKAYRNQPAEADLNDNYYALKGQNKREWDELRRSFPEDKYAYHYIYRNTYIEIPNSKREVLSLLDRQQHHEGFIFWNGKQKDSMISRKKMAMLTEVVAKATGEHKTSSYYQQFRSDSLVIAKFTKANTPSATLTPLMNQLLMKYIFRETIIPLHLFKLDKVRRMAIQSGAEKDTKALFKFNDKGQLILISDGRTDSTTISYRNNLPLTATRADQVINFYYKGDTVAIKANDALQLEKLSGKTFFNVAAYLVGDEAYSNMVLSDGKETKLTGGENSACVIKTEKAEDINDKICYSNTMWELPLTISINRNNRKATVSYTKDAANNLVYEDLNEYKSTKVEFVLKNEEVTNIKTYMRRKKPEYGVPDLFSISYEYFK